MRIFLIVAAGLVAVASPAVPERHAPHGAERQRPAPRQEVPGIVLIGMGASGLAIVGVASRRRKPGRRVTD